MILIVGATGVLGGMIARQLLARGDDVRVLVRHNSPSEELAKLGMATTAQSLVDAGAQPLYGDLKDPTSLDAACQGIDTVISTANSALRGGDDDVQAIEFDGNRNLIEAAAAAGVKRFIFVSALGASTENPVPFVQGKAKTEARLRASGIPYTILAPNIFMEVWVGTVVGEPLRAGRPVTLVGEANHRHALVSMGDVAAYAVAAVDNPAAIDQDLAIGGPEALTWRDVVTRAGQVVGQEIPIQFVAIGEPIPGMNEAVQPLMWSFETYETVLDITETAQTFGVEPTPFEIVAARLFGGASA